MMTQSKLARIKPLLYGAYWRAQTPKEEMLVRLMHQILFGFDMVYEHVE